MRVYKIERTDLDNWYVTPNLDDVAEEIKIALDEEIENFKELPIVIEEGLLPELIEKLKNAKVGESFELEMFKITVEEMTEEEYNSLPEFTGW